MSLHIEKTESIGPHYATTLEEWKRRFEANWETIKAESDGKFDQQFRRMWSFYFSYCEAAFAEGYLDVVHLVVRKTG